MSSIQRRRIAYSQNFLHSRRLIDRLLDRSSIGPDDLVVEIGPGAGAITARLARRCRYVLAIEKDPELRQSLRQRFAETLNVAVFEADFLQFPLPITTYKVFASIPFNVTAAIVAKLTTGPCPADDAFLVVQQEAAARFLGEPRESLSAVLLKPWFESTLMHRFRRDDFVPAPNVEVVMLRLRKRGPPLVEEQHTQFYRDFVTYAFTAWQPTLRAVLASLLNRASLDRLQRQTAVDLGHPPTATTFEAWLRLFTALQEIGDERASTLVAGAEERLRRQQADVPKMHRTRVSGRMGTPVAETVRRRH